jgi:pyruvate,orthophosphate dikinase
MFFASDRIDHMRAMILATDRKERKEHLATLQKFQHAGHARAVPRHGRLPVTIRLLDPPLHEFLPHEERTSRALPSALASRPQEIWQARNDLIEVNPMLGFRGCRLSVVYPEITKHAGARHHRRRPGGATRVSTPTPRS